MKSEEKYTSKELHEDFKRSWDRYSLIRKIMFRYHKRHKLYGFVRGFKFMKRMSSTIRSLIPTLALKEISGSVKTGSDVFYLDTVCKVSTLESEKSIKISLKQARLMANSSLVWCGDIEESTAQKRAEEILDEWKDRGFIEGFDPYQYLEGNDETSFSR